MPCRGVGIIISYRLHEMINMTAKVAQRISRPPKVARGANDSSNRFEPVKLDSLFLVLDAIAWLDDSSIKNVAQFAGVDPRTAGKVIKNATQIGLTDNAGAQYALKLPYPYKGTEEQKKSVVKEALARHPLLISIRQFVKSGDGNEIALRKAATIAGIVPFVPSDLHPLIEWASRLGALDTNLIVEDLVDAAETQKLIRHSTDKAKRVAFISHSSRDKPFVRQLAADLASNGVSIWLDEQRIHVGDSIPEKIDQGLASSDFFLFVMSKNSISSEWVKKELNSALVAEIQRRKVKILPIKVDDVPIPTIIGDKKYADFSTSYKSGLSELLNALKGEV